MVIFLSVVLGVGLLYAILLLTVSVISVRPPRVPVLLSPAQFGLPQEPVSLLTEDGVGLKGWWIQGPGPDVVVCVHGYLSNRCELAPYAVQLRQLGASVLLIDLRCHGSSDRAKVTYGLDEAEDVLAALRYAKTRSPMGKITVFASSMGAVAALRATLAEGHLVDGLILDGAYGRLDEAAKGFWEIGGFKSVAKLLAPTSMFGRAVLKVDPRKVVTRPLFAALDDVPMLLLYGTKDTVVPIESAKDCVEAAGVNAKTVWFEGCGHSAGRYSQPELYFDSIADFLRDNGLVVEPGITQRTQNPAIKAAGTTV